VRPLGSRAGTALGGAGVIGLVLGIVAVATDATLTGGLLLVALGSGLVSRAVALRRNG
jgi:hypothetical protein